MLDADRCCYTKRYEAEQTLGTGGNVSGMLKALAVTLALRGDCTSAGFPVFLQDEALFAVAVGSATVHPTLVHAASIVLCAWIVHCTATKHSTVVRLGSRYVPHIPCDLLFSFWTLV